ncbi:hypothetical protein B0H11DRAFT_1921918 [Mycena galericulata]|nr:hypothetical protein B0H11DRAFT_1921918 [Mycena galericulata]
MAELSAAQLARVALLHGHLHTEIARRDAADTSSFGERLLDEETPRGTIRPHDAMDNGNNSPLQPMPDALAPYTVEEGRAYKRHKNLSASSEADADMFLKSDGNKKYKLPDTVAKTAQDYAQCGLLSPNIKNYRNVKDTPTIASIVAVYMTLPDESAKENQKETETEAGSGSSETETANPKPAPKKAKVDIAKLTRNCISTSPVPPTAALYQRIAFISQRHIAAENPKLRKSTNDDGFWIAVDNELNLWRQSFTEGQMRIMFETVYDEDIKINGLPDHKISITELKNLENWVTTLDTELEKTKFSPVLRPGSPLAVIRPTMRWNAKLGKLVLVLFATLLLPVVVVVSLAHKGAVPPMRGRKTHTLYFTFLVERETSALGSKRVLRVQSLANPAFDILFPPIPVLDRMEKSRDFFTWRLGLTEARSNEVRGRRLHRRSRYLFSGLPTPRDTERASSFTLLLGSLGNCLQDQDKQRHNPPSTTTKASGKVPWILISHPRPLRCLPHRTLLAAVHLAHADDGPAGTHLLHARADPSMIGVSISISVWSGRDALVVLRIHWLSHDTERVASFALLSGLLHN